MFQKLNIGWICIWTYTPAELMMKNTITIHHTNYVLCWGRVGSGGTGMTMVAKVKDKANVEQ